MKYLALLWIGVLVQGCSGLFGGSLGTISEVCPYDSTVSATSAQCVPPPPPPPPPAAAPVCQWNSNILADDPQCAAAALRPVYFDAGLSRLRTDAQATLEAIEKVLRGNPGTLVRLEGNADDPGGEERNLTLGSRRAAAVKRFFVDRGIDPGRIEIISYGKERPVCAERDENCQQQNRRVDLVLTPHVREPVKLETFRWPPPSPTQIERIPARLCHDREDPTLGGSETKIRGAFRRAGYPDNMRTYMIGTDGIAVVGAMEAIRSDARFLPGNRRFLPLSARRTDKFEIGEFLRELFSSNTGHYRIIVVAVTPRATEGAFPAADPVFVRSLPERGNIGSLPPEEASVPLTMATPCYGIVYEFERPADPTRTRVVPSNARAKTHLVYAGLWSMAQLNQ